MKDYAEEYEFAKDLAVKCGQVALKYYSKCGGATAKQGVKIDSKLSVNDLVTAGDQATEKFFIESVKSKYPDHLILGEESSAAADDNAELAAKLQPAPAKLSELPDQPVWIVDPIDGTMSFVHGFDFWCVSIGLVAEGEVVFGVIYQPTKNLLYHGLIGQGSFCDNLNTKEQMKLRVSQQTTVKGSLLAGSVASNYFDLDRKALECGIHGIRAPGASALMLCDIAAGCCDFYTHIGIHSWDVCAGVRIVLEAGGRSYNADFSRDFDLFDRQVGVCATEELAKDVNEKLGKECLVGKDDKKCYMKRDVLAWA